MVTKSKIREIAQKFASHTKSVLETAGKSLAPSKKKLKKRTILKKSKATVNIPDYKAPSVLGDPNRFFKAEFDEAKRSAYTEW